MTVSAKYPDPDPKENIDPKEHSVTVNHFQEADNQDPTHDLINPNQEVDLNVEADTEGGE